MTQNQTNADHKTNNSCGYLHLAIIKVVFASSPKDKGERGGYTYFDDWATTLIIGTTDRGIGEYLLQSSSVYLFRTDFVVVTGESELAN